MVRDQFFHGDDHLFQIEGLDQITRRAPLKQLPHDGPIVVGAHDHKRNGAQIGVPVKFSAEVEPVHLGHAEVA